MNSELEKQLDEVYMSKEKINPYLYAKDDPKLPNDENGSPINLGFIPIQLLRGTLKIMSIPIVKTATEKTGLPTIGLRNVLSKTKPSRPIIKSANGKAT